MCIVLVHACNCTALTLHLRLHSATGLWRPHRRHWHAAAPSSAGHDAHVLRAWSPGRRHSTARLLRLLLWGRGVALRRHVVRRAVGGATGRVRTEALRVRSVRLQQQNNNASCCVFTSILQCLGCTCTLLKLRCLRYTARCLRCTARCLRYTAQCLLGTLHHALLTLYCARCLRCTAWCAAGPCCARARGACASPSPAPACAAGAAGAGTPGTQASSGAVPPASEPADDTSMRARDVIRTSSAGAGDIRPSVDDASD